MARHSPCLNILLLSQAIFLMVTAAANKNSHSMIANVDDGFDCITNDNAYTVTMKNPNDNDAISQTNCGNLLNNFMTLDFDAIQDCDKTIDFQAIVNFNQLTGKDIVSIRDDASINSNAIPYESVNHNNATINGTMNNQRLTFDVKALNNVNISYNGHAACFKQNFFRDSSPNNTTEMDEDLNANKGLEFDFDTRNSHEGNVSDAIDFSDCNFEKKDDIEKVDIYKEINNDILNELYISEMFESETSYNAIDGQCNIGFTSKDVYKLDCDIPNELDTFFDTYLDINPNSYNNFDMLNVTDDVLCFNNKNILEKNKNDLDINYQNHKTRPPSSSTFNLQHGKILVLNDQKNSLVSGIYEEDEKSDNLDIIKNTISRRKVDDTYALPIENSYNNQNCRTDKLVAPITQNVYYDAIQQNNDEIQFQNKGIRNYEHTTSSNTVQNIDFDLIGMKIKKGFIKEHKTSNYINEDLYQQRKSHCDQSSDNMVQKNIKEIVIFKSNGNVSLQQEKVPKNQGKKRKHVEELVMEVNSTLCMKVVEKNNLYQGKLIKIPICESSGSLLLYMETIQNHLKNQKNFLMENLDPYYINSSIIFVQKNITFENLDNEILICKDYKILLDIILSQIENTSFLKEYDKYKNGEEIQSQTILNLFNLLNNSPFLYYDPFYIWKTYHTINLDILLFYYIQCCNDKILNLINTQEKMVIGKFFDMNYIKVIAPKYVNDDQFVYKFLNYLSCILNKTKNSNDRNYTKKIIPKADIFTTACINFVENYDIDEHNVTKFIYYYKQINIEINNHMLDDTFQFDMLFKIASIKASQIIFEHFHIELIFLKIILIKCLENASKDFLLFFPEIEVLIDYIKAFKPSDVEILENKELFIYLYMLRILTDFACFSWYDIYTSRRIEHSDLHDNEYILLHSAFFSLVKYEISKFISYCIMRFVSVQRYKLYAHIRILEKIFLCGDAQYPFKFRSPKYSADFHIGKFNFLVKFIFIKELDPKLLLKFKYLPPDEAITYCCFETHPKKYFIGFFTAKKKHLYARIFLQYYVEIIRNNEHYNGLVELYKTYINDVFEIIEQRYSVKSVDKKELELLMVKYELCGGLQNTIDQLFNMFLESEKKHLLYGYCGS